MGILSCLSKANDTVLFHPCGFSVQLLVGSENVYLFPFNITSLHEYYPQFFFNVSCKLLLMNLLSLKKNKLHYIDRIYSFGFEEAFRDTPH